MSAAAADLMDRLAGRGVRFGLRGGRLALDAPAGTLTAEVRAAVTAHQDTIARLVRAATAPASDGEMEKGPCMKKVPHPAGRGVRGSA